MSDSIYIGTKVSNVDASPLFDTYSKVVINIDDETQISVGNNSGRTLELDNPFGTKEMAQSILNQLQGYQYQPHYSDGALLNPAAEIGDAVSVSNVYGGIYTRSRDFGRLMKADISAPCDEEINHEYAYESPVERKFTREVGDVRATLILTSNEIRSEVEDLDRNVNSKIQQLADEISAEVVLQEGGNRASFGWSLKATEFGLYANNQKVFWVNSSGAHVKGEITATTGTIGGFTIGANALQYNGLVWNDTSKNYGAYIGQSGIQLGKNFKVDNAGNVTANTMRLKGQLTFLNDNGSTAGTLTSARLYEGANAAYNGYSGWNGTTASWNNAQTYGSSCDYFKARTINAADTFIYRGAGMRLIWSDAMSCFVLGTYGEG